MKRKKFILLLLTVIVLVSFSFITRAQTGTLKGTVIDEQTKEPIPFALVKLINYSEFNVYHFDTVRTNKNGSYCFVNIPIGIYHLSIEEKNYYYYSINKNKVYIPKNKSTILVNQLHFAPISEGITVTYGDEGSEFNMFPLKRLEPSGETYTSEEINKMAW